MVALGDEVLRPFNQDVVQPRGLLVALAASRARSLSLSLSLYPLSKCARLSLSIDRSRKLSPLKTHNSRQGVLFLATLRDPLNIPVLLWYIGPQELLEWLGHFAAMLLYDAAHHALGKPARALAESLPPRQAFRLRRLTEAWEFGSGNDYGHT